MIPDPPHRKQVRRYDDPGDLHELTFSCHKRMPLLTNNLWRQMLDTRTALLGKPAVARINQNSDSQSDLPASGSQAGAWEPGRNQASQESVTAGKIASATVVASRFLSAYTICAAHVTIKI